METIETIETIETNETVPEIESLKIPSEVMQKISNLSLLTVSIQSALCKRKKTQKFYFILNFLFFFKPSCSFISTTRNSFRNKTIYE